MLFRSADPRLARLLVALHAAPAEAWPLERMAAQAGARHVYAVELLPAAAEQARAAFRFQLRDLAAHHRLRQVERRVAEAVDRTM